MSHEDQITTKSEKSYEGVREDREKIDANERLQSEALDHHGSNRNSLEKAVDTTNGALPKLELEDKNTGSTDNKHTKPDEKDSLDQNKSWTLLLGRALNVLKPSPRDIATGIVTTAATESVRAGLSYMNENGGRSEIRNTTERLGRSKRLDRSR